MLCTLRGAIDILTGQTVRESSRKLKQARLDNTAATLAFLGCVIPVHPLGQQWSDAEKKEQSHMRWTATMARTENSWRDGP